MATSDEAQIIASAKQKVQSFWTRDGSEYDNAEHHGINSPEEITKWEAILWDLIPEPSQVLDVGAGTGFCSLILAELGHEVTALDWSEEMLRYAKTKAETKGLTFQTVVSPIEDTKLESGSFDVITARHVLWTLLEPEAAIKEWARLLKKGGIAIVDLSLGMHSAHYEDDIEALLPMKHFESPDPVTAMFCANGFSEVTATIDDSRHNAHQHTHSHGGHSHAHEHIHAHDHAHSHDHDHDHGHRPHVVIVAKR